MYLGVALHDLKEVAPNTAPTLRIAGLVWLARFMVV
jgi:hypothetical protein